MYKLLVIGIIFLLGFYYIYRSNDIEAFTDKGDDNYKIAEKCPDVLIQKGSALFLYNSKRANVPGINPIRFENLEEYVEFSEWQRTQGILCPVLYLQHAYDAQGEPVYKARPSPTNLQGGQPDYYITSETLAGSMPNIMPPPANVPIGGLYGPNAFQMQSTMPLPSAMPMPMQVPNAMPVPQENVTNNNYPGFDPQNQTIGLDTPLDKMFRETAGVSANPMDDNWGGAEYTENLVKAGYYDDNEVYK
jgi:hypothetical protein